MEEMIFWNKDVLISYMSEILRFNFAQLDLVALRLRQILLEQGYVCTPIIICDAGGAPLVSLPMAGLTPHDKLLLSIIKAMESLWNPGS